MGRAKKRSTPLSRSEARGGPAALGLPMRRKEVRVYHAATLDGEGCLGVYQCSATRSPYNALYAVSQCGSEWLKELQQEAAVGFVCPARPQNGRRAASWQWRIWRAAELYAYLRAIRPFVRQKSDQVELTLEYLEGRIEGAEARKRFDAIRKKHHTSR